MQGGKEEGEGREEGREVDQGKLSKIRLAQIHLTPQIPNSNMSQYRDLPSAPKMLEETATLSIGSTRDRRSKRVSAQDAHPSTLP